MTGYASTQVLLASASSPSPSAPMRLGFEIRSVNSRFLDLGFRMPDELRMHEAALRDTATCSLLRLLYGGWLRRLAALGGPP